MENIEKTIEELKNDINVFKEYISCFCESEKAQALFEYNEDLNKLKDYLEK